MDIECRVLTEENLPDLLRFMEGPAFSDNPVWSTCYCVYHYLSDGDDPDWSHRKGEANRTTLCQMVSQGQGKWIVGYRHGEIVGWVNADVRPALRRYNDSGVPMEPDTGLVACFVVDPRFRRQGVARQLLDAALATLWTQGMNRVEVYTVGNPEEEVKSKTQLGVDQVAHHGPLSMYLGAGFTVVDTDGLLVHLRLTRPR